MASGEPECRLSPIKGHSTFFLLQRKCSTLCPGLSPSAQHVPRPDSWGKQMRSTNQMLHRRRAASVSSFRDCLSRCRGPSTSQAPGAVGRGPPSRWAQACCIHNAAAHSESQYCEYQGLFRPFLYLFNVSNKNTPSLPGSEPFFFFLHKTTSGLIASYYTSLWSGGSPGDVA